MSLDSFMDVVKSITSPPHDVFSTFFQRAIKIADKGVHDTFFPSDTTDYDIVYDKQTVDQYVSELAVKYLCLVMSKNTTNGFNNTIVPMDISIIDAWFDTNTNRVGEALFLGYMHQPDKLQGYFQDMDAWAEKIANRIAIDAFLTDFLIECQTKGSNLPAMVLLLVLKEMDKGGSNFTKVLDIWTKNPQWHLVEAYDSYPWLDGIKASFGMNTEIYNNVNQVISTQCNNNRISESSSNTCVSPIVARAGNCIPLRYRTTIYGPTVKGWLDSVDGPEKYGLRSNGYEKSPTTETVGDRGCVVVGTPILMADGSRKPVEQIREGDKVYSAHGHLSVCSSETVVNEHITQLYGINDEKPFMSYEHAVMTQRGWCSLAPHITKEFEPHLHVRTLSVGDVVWKIASVRDGGIEYKKEVVRKINTRAVRTEDGIIGFDLHFREGYQSYHANDYLCLLNYPQITLQRITSNVLSHMSPSEQIAFSKQMDDMSPLLDKALGSFVTEAVKESLKRPKESAARASHTDRHGVKKHFRSGAAEKIIPKLLVVPTAGGDALPLGFDTLSLMHGFLFINGKRVETHCDGDHVYWSRTGQDEARETGALKLHPHGLTGDGVVRRGETVFAFHAMGLVGYITTYKDDKGSGQSWWEFDMGFQKDDQGNRHAVGKLVDPTGAKQPDLDKHTTVVFSTVENKKSLTVLHADVEFNPSYCAFGWSPFIAAAFDFTMDYSSFSGTLYEYDSSSSDNRGQKHAITGSCKDAAALQDMMASITGHHLTTPINTAHPHLEQAPAIPSSRLMSTMALKDDIPMSVNDLFTLPAPELANVHQEAFAKLKTLMMYTIDDQWRGWFGEKKPTVGPTGDLTDSQAAIANDPDIKSFLTDQFAIGYLTQAFSQSAEPNIKAKFDAMKDAGDKLDFFWKGDKPDNCFGQYKAYSLATSKINDDVYAENVPTFSRYLENNPEQWAVDLYKFCTTEPTLTGLALQNTLDGRARLTHLVSMLHALDPIARIKKTNGKKVSYATSLYEQVMECRLNQIIANSSTSDHEDMAEFLTEFFRQYFNSLRAGDKWEDNILSKARKDLQKAMKDFQVDDENALVVEMGDIIADAVAILVNQKNLPIPARINRWAENNPKVSGAIRAVLTMGVYGYSIYASIKAFLEWGELKPEEKVQVITNVFDTTASMFNYFASYRAAKTLARANASVEELMNAVDALQAEGNAQAMELADRIAMGVINDVAELDAPALARAGEVAANAMVEEARGLAGTATRWMSVSKVAGVVAEGMTILAMGAACVATGFLIANDFASGQPTAIKVLDILSEVAQGVAFLATAGAGIAALAGIEVCSVIPVIGIVAVVAGILIALIEIFVHRTPPPTPEEEFVDAHCAPFILAKKEPGQDWIEKQKKVDEHLNKSVVADVSPSFALA